MPLHNFDCATPLLVLKLKCTYKRKLYLTAVTVQFLFLVLICSLNDSWVVLNFMQYRQKIICNETYSYIPTEFDGNDMTNKIDIQLLKYIWRWRGWWSWDHGKHIQPHGFFHPWPSFLNSYCTFLLEKSFWTIIRNIYILVYKVKTTIVCYITNSYYIHFIWSVTVTKNWKEFFASLNAEIIIIIAESRLWYNRYLCVISAGSNFHIVSVRYSFVHNKINGPLHKKVIKDPF